MLMPLCALRIDRGSKRIVYDLGRGYVIKIAKTKSGVRSNRLITKYGRRWLIMKKYTRKFRLTKKLIRKYRKMNSNIPA